MLRVLSTVQTLQYQDIQQSSLMVYAFFIYRTGWVLAHACTQSLPCISGKKLGDADVGTLQSDNTASNTTR